MEEFKSVQERGYFYKNRSMATLLNFILKSSLLLLLHVHGVLAELGSILISR